MEKAVNIGELYLQVCAQVRLKNLQLQRQRRSKLDRFFQNEENIFICIMRYFHRLPTYSWRCKIVG
jgi:hypothetical protein